MGEIEVKLRLKLAQQVANVKPTDSLETATLMKINNLLQEWEMEDTQLRLHIIAHDLDPDCECDSCREYNEIRSRYA